MHQAISLPTCFFCFLTLEWGTLVRVPQKHFMLSPFSPEANYSAIHCFSELPSLHLHISAAELKKQSSLFSKRSLTKEQRNDCPNMLGHQFCGWVPPKSVKQICNKLISLDHFATWNLLGCPLLPSCSCRKLPRMYPAQLESISDTLSPGGFHFFWIKSQQPLFPHFLSFSIWKHFSMNSVFSSVLGDPTNSKHQTLNE